MANQKKEKYTGRQWKLYTKVSKLLEARENARKQATTAPAVSKLEWSKIIVTDLLFFTLNLLISKIWLLRACLHGGGGHQVGEVTRLTVVEK